VSSAKEQAQSKNMKHKNTKNHI